MVSPTATEGIYTLDWSLACSTGAEDYAIYEGDLDQLRASSTYDHTLLDCSDEAGDLMEEVEPVFDNSYFLVVPLNQVAEGGYGLRDPRLGVADDGIQAADVKLADEPAGFCIPQAADLSVADRHNSTAVSTEPHMGDALMIVENCALFEGRDLPQNDRRTPGFVGGQKPSGCSDLHMTRYIQ